MKMPMVVGYLVAGVILGPSATGLVSLEMNESLELIKILGLGLIAILISGAGDQRSSTWKDHYGITVVQVLGTCLWSS